MQSMERQKLMDDSLPGRRRPHRIALIVLVAAAVGWQPAAAVEVMSARDLGEQCRHFPDGPSEAAASFCAHYIQGFIDGAVSTDVRVMLNIEAQYEESRSLTERAMQTRMPGWHDQQRAAGYAEFCLGDPLPLRDVVEVVAGQLTSHLDQMDPSLAARDAVYTALREHYPC
jgi:hypothetical protein